MPLSAPSRMGRGKRAGAGSRLLLSVAALGLAVYLTWQMITGLIGGVGQVFGLASSAGAAPETVQLNRTYTVAPGDTIAGIAARFALPAQELVRANHLAHPDRIFAGQKLLIPSPYQPRATAWLIRSTAQRFHLDPAFAEAVGWQESGFDENVISDTGAVGIMQVEPGTAQLVARDLGRSVDLGLPSDDVTVGCYWLAYLVRLYGGNEHAAAAAYYEGVGNLAQRGYLPGTAQYVADVMTLRQSFAHNAWRGVYDRGPSSKVGGQ